MGQPIASWTWLANLYRFAMILTLDEVKASEATRGALEEALKNRNGHWDEERGHIFLFRAVRNRCMKLVKPPAKSALVRGELPANAAASVGSEARVTEALHQVAEPARSAFALLLIDALDAEAVGKLLGMGVAELADLVQSARLELYRRLTGPSSSHHQPGAAS